MASRTLVPPRPLVSAGPLLAMAWALTSLGPAPEPPARPGAPPTAETKAKAETPAESAPQAKTVPRERRPYRIRAWVVVGPGARLDQAGRAGLVATWLDLVHRFVGSAWELEVADGPGPLQTATLEGLGPEAVAPLAAGVDKAWIIEVNSRPDSDGFDLTGREFDTATGLLGPPFRRSTPFPAYAARSLLDLALTVFSPLAEIGDSVDGAVLLSVQGAALTPPDPIGQVVSIGSVFRPLRFYPPREAGAAPQFREISYTYLQVESLAGASVRCRVVSALRAPLTRRVIGPSRIVALGIKPSDQPTRLQFLTRGDKAPGAGYLLIARSVPNGAPREVGTTNREGRIVLEPGFAENLVVLRLLAGNAEPLAEFPVMPGADAGERSLIIDPKPQAVALETTLASIRDELIDLVASRARLEARLKARVAGRAWDEARALITEYQKLPDRQTFQDRLTKLREEALAQQSRRVAVLTKTAQAQFADLQAVVDRYLTDDALAPYLDALKEARVAVPAAPAPPASPGPTTLVLPRTAHRGVRF